VYGWQTHIHRMVGKVIDEARLNVQKNINDAVWNFPHVSIVLWGVFFFKYRNNEHVSIYLWIFDQNKSHLIIYWTVLIIIYKINLNYIKVHLFIEGWTVIDIIAQKYFYFTVKRSQMTSGIFVINVCVFGMWCELCVVNKNVRRYLTLSANDVTLLRLIPFQKRPSAV